MDDVNRIESGDVELPPYNAPSEGSTSDEVSGKKVEGSGRHEAGHGGKADRDQERRKGIAWTKEEHRCPSFSLHIKFIFLCPLNLMIHFKWGMVVFVKN